MLTPDMKRIIEEQLPGFVATTAPDGTPNVSPKGTFFVVDDETCVRRNPLARHNPESANELAHRDQLRRSFRAQGLSSRRDCNCG